MCVHEKTSFGALDANITIIGAGVIGLAISVELKKYFTDVFVIEQHPGFGQETSSRNSEIIHSGVYYPKASLKAQLCIEGKALLYKYCVENHIPHKRCGKLIISLNTKEDRILKEIFQSTKVNGVTDHSIIGKPDIQVLEPHINANKAVYFPSTGLVDSFQLMKSLETKAVNGGVEMVYGSEVTAVVKINNGYRITIRENDQRSFQFTSRWVINCAGLHAEKLSHMIGISNRAYKTHFWKGEYFSLMNGKHKLLSHLVYPIPEEHAVGLGIHTTMDLSGRVKLGPNAIYLPDGTIDYSIDPGHKSDFFNAVRPYLPFLEIDDLAPDQAGIRPKLQKPGDPVRDFIISEETMAGCPGFINLLGIESPGLTACLSIARHVNMLMQKKIKHQF